MSGIVDIAISNENTKVPYFPSYSWGLTAADFAIPGLPTFNWIQAFWDVVTYAGTTPQLIISTGDIHDDGTLIVSAVPFAYSGERVNIKGRILLASGVDRRGITVTSTPINSGSPANSILKVVAYGGDY